ncbi:helix-turn-helix transcriptional regulator [Ruegeria pomeroyi]|nr:helix-turn-helix transcriptional regulator [Ruegeria pomeroyi]
MRDWQTIEVPKIQALSRPVYLRSQSLPARHGFPLHTHPWHQFVYATSGTLMVTIEQARYVITPEQAIWIPTGVRHTTTALSDVEFRNLYIEAVPHVGMPDQCSVYAVSTLLRALILELAAIDQDIDLSDYRNHLDAVILQQIRQLRRLDFYLPWPQENCLREICEILYNHPDDGRGIGEWAAFAGMSTRTLARHFTAQTGMSLRVWRHRLRVFRAVELLATCRRVTDVAFELGFSSASAFSFAFRSEMGCTPTEWIAQ